MNDCITFTETSNAVSITIKGTAFNNLKEIAEIFNRWNDCNETAADIVRRFLCNGDDWRYLGEKNPNTPFTQTLTGEICEAFSECADMKKLEADFIAAGFSTQR